MKLLVVAPLVLLLAACMCRADVIETNEIDDDDDDSDEVSRDSFQERAHDVPLAEVFDNAVQAYLEEDWRGCILSFNEALHRYVGVILGTSSRRFFSPP